MTTPKNTKRPTKHMNTLAEKLKTQEAPIPRNVRTPHKFMDDLTTCVNRTIAAYAVERRLARDYEHLLATLAGLEAFRSYYDTAMTYPRKGSLIVASLQNFVSHRESVERALQLAGPREEGLRADYYEFLSGRG